jgi:hypothetical protein
MLVIRMVRDQAQAQGNVPLAYMCTRVHIAPYTVHIEALFRRAGGAAVPRSAWGDK